MKIDPLALNPDVGFVHSPTVVGRSEPRAQSSFHFWGIPLDPTPHRDVIGVQTSLGEQLLDVPVRQGKRRYQPTARRMTSGSNCLHLNRPETDDARSIGGAYQSTPAKLQHCPLEAPIKGRYNPATGRRSLFRGSPNTTCHLSTQFFCA